jgi:hypothetical protein
MVFDCLAASISWLDAYQGQSLDIVDMYAPDAFLECKCHDEVMIGLRAIETFWRKRLSDTPLILLINLKPKDGGAVAVTYSTPTGAATAILGFDEKSGKIVWHRCEPVEGCDAHRIAAGAG